MPRVPVYQQQVGQAAMPTPMERPAPVGAGAATVGQALSQAGGQIAAIAEKERQQAERVQITNFETAAEERWTQDFYDDENGFRRLKGEEAFGKEEELIGGYEQFLDEQIRQIASPRAREAAMIRKAQILADRRRQTEQYLGQQREASKSAALVGRKATSQDAIARNYADPAFVAESMGEVRAAIYELAVSKEAADADWQEYQQQVAAIRVQRFLDDRDIDGARAVYAQTAGVLGKDASRLKRAIDVVEREEVAERDAAGIIEGATEENGRVDNAAALAKLDDIEDVQHRDAVRQRLEHRLRQADAQWKRTVGEHVNTALTQYESNGLSIGAIDGRTKDWLIENAPDEWTKIRMMARRDSEYWRRRQAGESGLSDEDLRARADLIEAMREDPEGYAEMSAEDFFNRWRPLMSESSFKWAVSQFDQHGRRVRSGQVANMSEFNVSVKAALGANGITSKKHKDQFTTRMNGWLDSYLASHNQKWPTQDEIRAEIARQVEDVKIPGRIWGEREVPRYRADPDRIIEDGEPEEEEPAAEPRLSMRDRARQLFQQGVSAEEAERILASEGY